MAENSFSLSSYRYPSDGTHNRYIAATLVLARGIGLYL